MKELIIASAVCSEETVELWVLGFVLYGYFFRKHELQSQKNKLPRDNHSLVLWFHTM